jgi:hypothetical protein
LNTQAQALGKYPPQLGYVLVDSNSNDWWYNGTEWINIGYYDVAQATNASLGVVKGSTANMKVSVDGSGEMSVNGLQSAMDAIAFKFRTTADLNTAIESGYYLISNDIANFPQGSYGWGMLVVFSRPAISSNSGLTQLYITDNGNYYFRTAWGSPSNGNPVIWKPWIKLVLANSTANSVLLGDGSSTPSSSNINAALSLFHANGDSNNITSMTNVYGEWAYTGGARAGYMSSADFVSKYVFNGFSTQLFSGDGTRLNNQWQDVTSSIDWYYVSNISTSLMVNTALKLAILNYRFGTSNILTKDTALLKIPANYQPSKNVYGHLTSDGDKLSAVVGVEIRTTSGSLGMMYLTGTKAEIKPTDSGSTSINLSGQLTWTF